MALLSRLLAETADLLWPPACPQCGAAVDWCVRCRPDAGVHGRLVLLDDGTPVAAPDVYAGATSAAVRSWKLAGRRALTPVLAELVADAVVHLLGEPAALALVPVPVRPSSRRRRGEDLIAGLATATARQLPGAAVVGCLRWRRAVAEQVGAAGVQRHRNLAGAMTADPPPSCSLLVIDDVLTSGATMTEAVRALRSAGGRQICGAVIAVAGQRRSGERLGAVAG